MGKTKRILNGLMAMVVMAGGVIWSGGEARAIEYGSGEGEALVTAVNAVEDGGSLEVMLTESVEVTKPVVVQPGAKVTLNLAGHTLGLNVGAGEAGYDGWPIEVRATNNSAAKKGELTIVAGAGGKVTNEPMESRTDVKGLIRNIGRLTIEGGEFVDITTDGTTAKAMIMNHGTNGGSSVDVNGGLNISGASFLAKNGNACIYTEEIGGPTANRLVGTNVIKNSSFKTVGNMTVAVKVTGGAGLTVEGVTIESYGDAMYLNGTAAISNPIKVEMVNGNFKSSAGTALVMDNVVAENVWSGMQLAGKNGLIVNGDAGSFYKEGVMPVISDGVIVGTVRAVRLRNAVGSAELDDIQMISGGQYGVGTGEDLGRYVVDGKKAYVYAGENGVNRIVEDEVTDVSATLKVGETVVDTLTEGDAATVVASATPASSSTGFTYESSNESVVRLSDDCNTAKSGSCAVTAVGAGTATITVKSTFEPEVVATVSVTVEEEVIVVPTVLRGTYSTAAGAAVQGSVELMNGAEKVLDDDVGEVGLVIEKTAGSGSTLGTYAVKLVDGEGEVVDASLTDGKKWQIKIKLDTVGSDDYYTVDGEKVDFDAASGEISFERAELGNFTVGVVKKKIYIPKTSTTSDGSSVIFPDGVRQEVLSAVELRVDDVIDTETLKKVEEGLDDLTETTYDAKLMGVYDVRFVRVGTREAEGVNLAGGKKLTVTLKVGADKFSEKDTGYEVYYVDRSNGYSLTKMDGVEGDATAGTVKFTTSHLSDYAVVALQESEGGGGSGGDGGGGSGGDGGGESGGETGGGESGGEEGGGESGGGESGDGGGDSGGESGGETGGGDEGGSENGNESGNESGSGTSGESGGTAGDGGLPAVETDVRKALGWRSRLETPDTGVTGAGGGDGGMLGIEVAMWTSGILVSGAYGVRRMYARRGRGS